MAASPFTLRPRAEGARNARTATRLAAAAAALAIMGGGFLFKQTPALANADTSADTALVVAIDISRSVNEHRYRLQVEGIAEALEDPSVVAAMTGGPRGSILFSLVTWADHPTLSIDWLRIADERDAARVAMLVRGLNREAGRLTCLARMLNAVSERVVPRIPFPVRRVIVDVSGDNVDNCDDIDGVHAERDRLLAKGAAINGLPILVGGVDGLAGSNAYRPPGFDLQELPMEMANGSMSLDQWYRDHVVGGPSAFVLAARGYADFARALKEKLLTEISMSKKRGIPYESVGR